jgi:hypothetical protein
MPPPVRKCSTSRDTLPLRPNASWYAPMLKPGLSGSLKKNTASLVIQYRPVPSTSR